METNGTLCDEGSKSLLGANKLSVNQALDKGEVGEWRKGKGRYMFALCIRGQDAESLLDVKRVIRDTLIIVRERMVTRKLKEISIAKSEMIENLPWSEILNLLDEIFENAGMKIICTGKIKYVE